MKTKQQIQAEINAENRAIRSEKVLLNRAENEIGQAEKLLTKLITTRESFQLANAQRVARVSSVREVPAGVSVVEKYSQGMNGLLSGSQYRSLISHFSTVIARVQKYKADNVTKAGNLQNDINYHYRKIKYLQDELQYAE